MEVKFYKKDLPALIEILEEYGYKVEKILSRNCDLRIITPKGEKVSIKALEESCLATDQGRRKGLLPHSKRGCLF